MRILKILLLFVAIFACSEVASGQTFKVTGYENNAISETKLQKFKAEALGSKVTLEIYENDAKVIVHLKDGETDTTVFSKTTSQSYVFNRGKDTATLELTTYLGYIKRGVIKHYNDGKLQGVITFERDGIF